MKLSFLFVALLLFTSKAFTQKSEAERLKEQKEKLAIETDSIKKADLLHSIASSYVASSKGAKIKLDSASILNKQLLRISRKLDSKKHIAKSMLLDGWIAAEQGDKNLAFSLRNSALDYAITNDLKKEQASAYKALALTISQTDIKQIREYYLKAASIYKQENTPGDVAKAYYDLAVIFSNNKEADSCIKYVKQSIQIKKNIDRKDLYKEYILLGNNYWSQSKYEETLTNALLAEKNAEELKIDGIWLIHTFNIIAIVNCHFRAYDKSLEYYNKALLMAKKYSETKAEMQINKDIAYLYYMKGDTNKALKILENTLKYQPKENCNAVNAAIYVLVYCKLKKYDKATPYYKQIYSCNYEDYSDYDKETIYHAMVQYYINFGDAKNAYLYIDKIKKLKKGRTNVINRSELEKTFYKADSISGNYKGAIEHLKKVQAMNDSIFTINSAKQIHKLQVKYETEKKDKNIKLLKQQDRLQKEKLRHATILRYIFLCGLVMMALIVALFYNRARLKQKSNKKLQLKQEKINSQYEELKKLLTEREWLLKEIHHRVKNNLQIVISLLNSQSAFLENKDALMALQNSQHRMQAISLIHQKLYQSDNLTSIDMLWYINELVDHLRESFNIDKKIDYLLDIDSVKLDESQAVPLGLILNEAISNAIKYAFVNKEYGKITISLKNIGPDTYRLVIADNGLGLPTGFEQHKTESLGMYLMLGLTAQLEGTFELGNIDGLCLTIIFTQKRQVIPDESLKITLNKIEKDVIN